MRLTHQIFFTFLIIYAVAISIMTYQNLSLFSSRQSNGLFLIDSEKISENDTLNLGSDLEEDIKKTFSKPRIDILQEKSELQIQILEPEIPTKSMYEIFKALGAYPEAKPPYVWLKKNQTKFRLRHENDYCSRVDQYNSEHPLNMFENKILYSDFPRNTFAYAAAKRYGKVIDNQIIKQGNPSYVVSSGFDISVTRYFISLGVFANYYKIGQQFLCTTQMYNQIPGHYSLVSKDTVINSVQRYMKDYTDRPQCFNKSSLFPISYRLHNKKECQTFFKIINSQEYQATLAEEPLQYLIKVTGKHQGVGVSVFNKAKRKSLNTEYKYGESCGTNKRVKIAQKYITNPLLLNDKHKFDFRIYMLVASTNPLIVYYHDGFLRISLEVYDKFSSKKGVHLTNTHLSDKILKSGKKSEISNWWSLDQLQNYLYEKGLIDNKKWLDNYLRPAFHRALIHLTRMAKYAFWNQSNVYALHGVDFMLDDKLNLWFIESNPSPQWGSASKSKNVTYKSVLAGHFEIMNAYYRSRMKRVFEMVRRMQKEDPNMKDIEHWRHEYRKAARNRLESEYKISSKNNFQLILDENLRGERAYLGSISKDCI